MCYPTRSDAENTRLRAAAFYAGDMSILWYYHINLEWALLHQQELLDNWELARQQQPLRSVEPLE